MHKECSLIRVTLLSADDRCILLRSTAPTQPRHGLISSSENYGQKLFLPREISNEARSRTRWLILDTWNCKFFFFFQLLNLSSNRFLIKIEILRIVYYYERIISTIFLRLRLFMKRRCLIYVYSSLMARPATRKVLSFFGLFFQHISRGTACPTRGRKGLHSPRQKVINDRKTS